MFEEVIGHDINKKLFTHLMKNDVPFQSYLFVGKSGIGKKMFAMEIANKLSGMNRNIHYIEPEKNNIPVDAIRQLKEDIVMPPFNGLSNRRVVVIDNADCMNESAQNAFLKILEEPPSYVSIILITNNLEGILGTIQSRCPIAQFLPVDDMDILEILVKKSFDKALTDFLLTYIGGSIGRANEIVDNSEKLNNVRALYSFINKLLNTRKPTKESVYDSVQEIFTDRQQSIDNLEVFLNYCVDLYIKSFDSRLLDVSKIITLAIEKLKRGGNLNLSVIVCILDIIKVNAKKKTEE